MENKIAVKPTSSNNHHKLPSEEELKEARRLVETARKERESQFVAEFNALKEKYSDITIDFIIQNEQDLVTKIYNEVKSAAKVMSVLAK